jgi:L-alanine-DL-glutamate epimerase-like enolase superfamily enzyme
MKIAKVEIIPVDVPCSKVLTLARYGRLGEGRPFEFVILRVTTDEGVSGVGECPPLPPLSPESQPVIVDVLSRWLVPNIRGMDPFENEAIWEKMDYFAPTYPMAKAAIDMALWDIKGKVLDLPLYRMLGGSPPVKIPNVALIGIDEPEKVAETALNLVSDGFSGIRLKVGPGKDVRCVEAARDAIGEEVSLRIDCNQGYSASDAVKMIRLAEEYGVELVEQPTVWWDFNALSEVAASVDTPIMPHESLYLLSDVKNLIDAGAVGVLGLKTYRPWGGVTGARRLLEMARVMNIQCLFHDDIEMGVSLSAATHLITAYSRVLTHKCELSGFPEWMVDDIVTKPIRFEKGYVYPPEGPGLGVELDEDKIKKYGKKIISLK